MKPTAERQILHPSNPQQANLIAQLIDDPKVTTVDQMAHQLEELLNIFNLEKELYEADIKRVTSTSYSGVWVFYPWQSTMVRILDEQDFVTVRTNRNKNKITTQEQHQLSKKKIGIIGMSVGRAVATTMALERIFGTVCIADHDTLDLSNLNRLKAPIWDLGKDKVISVQREIHGFDPFLNIEVFPNGIDEGNIESFLSDGGKLDLLIDECDSLEIKILCRKVARSLGIPVMMETSDRGMLDVERFDLEPDRPIFHGRLEHVDFEKLDSTSPESRMLVLDAIVDLSKVSERGMDSFKAINRTLLTWPQLASAVACGGGVVTDTARRILLNQFNESGRYYVDIQQIIKG